MSGLSQAPARDVLAEGSFSSEETTGLLDAAQAAVAALTGRKRIARFDFEGQRYRAKASRIRLHVSTADNRRYVAYRWREA
nr:hypothetical protein [uncultured Sphingomonas sp.]